MIADVPEFLLLGLAFVALAIGFVLSAAEGALQRITRAAVSELRHEGKKRADSVERIVASRHAAQTGVSFFRLLAEMTAAVCLTLAIADWLPEWWQVLLVAVISSALIISLVVGASPREMGRRHPERVLHTLSGVVLVLTTLARPVVTISNWITSNPVRAEDEQDDVAADNLRDMVDLVSESEQIEDDEREMLHSLFELGSTLTREVMVPRTEMITVHADAALSKAVALFVRSGFSRVPVIGDEVDDLRGILFLKDAIRAQRRHPEADLTAADAMRPARFVPEMKPVDDLLREMQTGSSHIAIVVDEYGGVAGLVTIEDLIEELVGELVDEHDADLPEVEDLGDGVYRVPARMAIDEIGDLFDLEVADDDVDTAGGLLAKALGKVPIEGSEGEIYGMRISADRFEGRRRMLSTVLVSRAHDGGGAQPEQNGIEAPTDSDDTPTGEPAEREDAAASS